MLPIVNSLLGKNKNWTCDPENFPTGQDFLWHLWLLDCVHEDVQRSTARDWIVLPLPTLLILGEPEATRLAENRSCRQSLSREYYWDGGGGTQDSDLLASSEDSQNGQRLSLKGTFYTCLQTSGLTVQGAAWVHLARWQGTTLMPES